MKRKARYSGPRTALRARITVTITNRAGPSTKPRKSLSFAPVRRSPRESPYNGIRARKHKMPEIVVLEE